MTSPYAQEKSGCNELESEINRRRGRLTTLTGGLKKGLHVLSGDKAFSWAIGPRHLDLFFPEICLAFLFYLTGYPFPRIRSGSQPIVTSYMIYQIEIDEMRALNWRLVKVWYRQKGKAVKLLSSAFTGRKLHQA